MPGAVVTPAAGHLYTTSNKCKKLDEERAQYFHTIVAKLLFRYTRARSDIHTAVAFLCTRIKAPDKDDWKKLKRCVAYLRMTLDLVMTLGCELDILSV